MIDNLYCYVDKGKLHDFLYLHYPSVCENGMTYQSDIFEDNHIVQLHDDMILELMNKFNLLLRREESMNSDNEIPIIIKAVFVGEDNTIYLADEYFTSRRNRVTLPGGHLRVDDSYTKNKILMQLHKRLWDEMTVDGIDGWNGLPDMLKPDISSGLSKGVNEFFIDKVSSYMFCKYDELSGLYLFIPMKIRIIPLLPTDLRTIIPMDVFDYDVLKRKYDSMDIIHPTREEKERIKRIISGNEFAEQDDVRFPIPFIQVLTPIFQDIHKFHHIFSG